jgi:hypothetical protein
VGFGVGLAKRTKEHTSNGKEEEEKQCKRSKKTLDGKIMEEKKVGGKSKRKEKE